MLAPLDLELAAGEVVGLAGLYPSDGVLEQFGGVVELELLLDVLAMRFHRLDAQIELVGYLLISVTHSQKPKHFSFPLTEPIVFPAFHRADYFLIT